MHLAPPPYDRPRQLTFTETVLAQLRSWPWIDMASPDSARNPSSSTPTAFHSIAPNSSQNHDPHAESGNPEDSW